MGWDITYHPLDPKEIESVYLAGLKDPSTSKTIVETYQLDESWVEGLAAWLQEQIDNPASDNFNSGYGHRIAVMAGLLRKYWYIRGSAFTFLLEENEKFQRYIADWKDILPEELLHLDISNGLTHNYMAGVFLPYQGLCALKKDYDLDPEIKTAIDEIFSHNRLPIFWQAVDYAIEHQLGLLEASEIVEPNPFEIESSNFLSDANNCHTEGIILYIEAATEQLMAVMESQESSASHSEEDQQVPKKKSFWQRLLRK